MFLFMGVCFSVAALGLLGGALWAYFKQQRQMESWVAATGTVVELTTQATARGSIICPVVEFTATSGEKVRFTSEFGSRPAGHKVGQSVNVRYDAADPQKAEIESAMKSLAYPAYSSVYECHCLLSGGCFPWFLRTRCFAFISLRSKKTRYSSAKRTHASRSAAR